MKKGLIAEAENFTQKLHTMKSKKEAKDEVKRLFELTNTQESTLTKKQLEDFFANYEGEAMAEDSESVVQARGSGIFDEANVAWANTWSCINEWAEARDDGELCFTQEALFGAYSDKFVAQAKVELWDARDKLKREEDEAPPIPIQFRNLGGTDAPLLSTKL